MGARLPQEFRLSLPPCLLNSTSLDNSSTCITELEPMSFSSTLVLIVLAALIFCLIVLSIVTFHIHKSKMKKRKIQKAQEEYERDHCSPGEAAGRSPGGGHVLLGRPARDSACSLSPTIQRNGQKELPPGCPGSLETPGAAESCCTDSASEDTLQSVILS